MLLVLPIPVGPDSRTLITHSVRVCVWARDQAKTPLDVFKEKSVGANSCPVFKLGWGGVWVLVWVLSGWEAAGSGNGWIWSEAEWEMGAAVCACQRQGHPLGDVRPWHCHFGYHGDAVNEHMHRKVVANHSISVLEVCGGNHYTEARLAASLSLVSVLFLHFHFFPLPVFNSKPVPDSTFDLPHFFMLCSQASNPFLVITRPHSHCRAPSNMALCIFKSHVHPLVPVKYCKADYCN